MLFESTRFGQLDITDDKVIQFPAGLLGFESSRAFVIIDADDVAPMRWMQSVTQPEVAFLIVEPLLFFPDYQVKLTEEDCLTLQLGDAEPVCACLVSIPADPQMMTINLMGPLVFSVEHRVGKQLVLHDSHYSVRQRLIPDEALGGLAQPVSTV
jgi:flagellar assembly factor FliW